MPIYEFRCGSCKKRFEELCRSAEPNGVRCPSCGYAKVSRLISSFAVSHSLTPCGTRSAQAAPG